ANGRWRRHGRILFATGALLAATPLLKPVGAQSRQGYTLEDVLVSLRRAADTLDLSRVSPAQDRALDSVSALFRGSGAASLTIDALADIVTKTKPSFSDV